MGLRWLLGAVSPGRFPPSPVPHKSETMAAVVMKAHGEASVLEYVEDFPLPTPAPKTRQVTIEVVACGINPVDFKMRRSHIPDLYYPKPKIQGLDVAGIVVDTPPNSKFSVGQPVFAMLPLLGTQYGGYASRVCVDEANIAGAPDTVPLEDMAALPLVACTVVQALRPVVAAFKGDTEGKKCFIQGGSGGVGSLAVQYCAAVLRMRVVASCSAKNAHFVKMCGAVDTVDYMTENFEDKIQDYDVVIDPLAYLYEQRTLHRDSGVLKRSRDAHYVHIASSPWQRTDAQEDPLRMGIPEAAPHRMVTGFCRAAFSSLGGYTFQSGPQFHYVFVHPDGEALALIAQAVQEGKIRPYVDQKFPIEEAQDAQRVVEEGHVKGKVIMTVTRPGPGRREFTL